jgi:hypothetical protein
VLSATSIGTVSQIGMSSTATRNWLSAVSTGKTSLDVEQPAKHRLHWYGKTDQDVKRRIGWHGKPNQDTERHFDRPRPVCIVS